MENLLSYSQNNQNNSRQSNIHKVINYKIKRFLYFFAEKRYKLINFAPKKEIVDKVAE